MKLHSRSLPLMVVAAVVALVVGSIGTAVAGPAITKKKVKAIATKVVNKQAPSLSVASAATAGNATNLAGKPASAYVNQVYNFVLPTSTPTTNVRTFNLPGVPPGTYTAEYTVLAQGTSGADYDCYFRTSPTGTTADGWSYPAKYSSFASLNASTLLTLTSAVPHLYCESSANFGVTNGGLGVVSRVTLTRVDAVVNGTTAIPPAGPAAGGSGTATVR